MIESVSYTHLAAAYSVGVSEEEVKLARLLGEYIGICFQIKDDIFDYFDKMCIRDRYMAVCMDARIRIMPKRLFNAIRL